MASMRLWASLFELVLMVGISSLIIAMIYRIFLKANPDFDMEQEIKNGNAAVGILMAVIMISAALILQSGLAASINNFRLSLSAPPGSVGPLWQSGLLIVAHLVASIAIAVFTISVALRLFGKLTRKINPEMHLGRLLKEGNVAVGIILAAVVLW